MKPLEMYENKECDLTLLMQLLSRVKLKAISYAFLKDMLFLIACKSENRYLKTAIQQMFYRLADENKADLRRKGSKERYLECVQELIDRFCIDQDFYYCKDETIEVIRDKDSVGYKMANIVGSKLNEFSSDEHVNEALIRFNCKKLDKYNIKGYEENIIPCLKFLLSLKYDCRDEKFIIILREYLEQSKLTNDEVRIIWEKLREYQNVGLNVFVRKVKEYMRSFHSKKSCVNVFNFLDFLTQLHYVNRDYLARELYKYPDTLVKINNL